jgi:hypothetical protein
MKSNLLVLLICFTITLLGLLYLNQSSVHYEDFEDYEKDISISKYYEKENKQKGLYDRNMSELGMMYMLRHNSEISILGTDKFIVYQKYRVAARRQQPIHLTIYSTFTRKNYELWRYPDFVNNTRRHSKDFMSKYLRYFKTNILPSLQNNCILDFIGFHGVLDNKIHLWNCLEETYGRKIASSIMPMNYVIPKDIDLFKETYQNQPNTPFILKNAHLGNKESIYLSNSYQEICQICDNYLETARNDPNKDISNCSDSPCYAKFKYNTIQPYLSNLMLIEGYKFNFRFFLVFIWNNNRLEAKLYKEFYLSYSQEPFQANSNNFKKNITSYSHDDGFNKSEITTIKLNRPYNHRTFRQYLEKHNLSYDVFIENLTQKLHLFSQCFQTQVLQGCYPDVKQFHIYALDVELTNSLQPVVYEANHYFILHVHEYGKQQAALYEDIFFELGITSHQNYGFWNLNNLQKIHIIN